MKLPKTILFAIVIQAVFSTRSDGISPIPPSSRQMILVVTDSVRATKGILSCFEKNTAGQWTLSGKTVPVVIGRNGLGGGIGLHDSSDLSGLPRKEEGDGRSPAGVFSLGSAFGLRSAEQMAGLKTPYIHVTEMTECVDDVKSVHYNRIVSRDSVEKSAMRDWMSSERMSSYVICYDLGVVVDHNQNPIRRGSGSCIFLHIWSDSDRPTAGCTAMAASDMERIMEWLDAAKHPVLVQLTESLYRDLHKPWNLPGKKDQPIPKM
jgi:L,D-peptidoglycan transpeptidase YkuD (ErfK/YbiS/YcfS/YnhG family)